MSNLTQSAMSSIARLSPEKSAAMTIREFIRIEKNLTTLGFFTPTQGRGKIINRPKVLRVRRELPGGKIVEAEATIIPSVEHGLPTTPDQDKYLAFQQIVQERRKANGGRVENPIPFTSYELCMRVGLNTGGKNYADISEWLDRMVATTIRSKGTVYLAKRKTYVKDTFHVFDRVVVAGEDLPNGKVAEQNYVWLSEWQIENLNERYQLPVDFESYKQLRTHIGKALVPLLQVWLYPTRSVGKFEKRYADVCELLSLRLQGAPSLIDRQLRPALEELMKMGYISNWAINRTADNLDHKLVLFHGPKYLNDLKLLSTRSEESETVIAEPAPELVEKLAQRGMSVRMAKKLLECLPCNQSIHAQLEWCDAIIQKGRIENPVGFIYSVLKNNELVPESFETTDKRTARLKKEHEDLAAYARRLEQEQQYERYVEEAITTALSATYATDDYEGALKRFAPEIRKQYPNLPSTTIRELSETRLKQEIRASLELMSIEEFIAREQYPLFS
jgi:Replication initiator protein A